MAKPQRKPYAERVNDYHAGVESPMVVIDTSVIEPEAVVAALVARERELNAAGQYVEGGVFGDLAASAGTLSAKVKAARNVISHHLLDRLSAIL